MGALKSLALASLVAVLAVGVGLYFHVKGKLLNTPLGTDSQSISMETDAYDYIIVGSGSAGSVLALRLSESGARVLVLEAGSDDHNLYVSIPAASPVLQRVDSDWAYKTTPQTKGSQGLINRQVRWPRGRIVGGSSSINYMIYARGHRGDYNEWANAYNATGWDFRELLPYFKKSEQMTIPELRDSTYHGTNGTLTVSALRYVHGATKAFVQAAREFGIQETEDYNSHQNQGVSLIHVTQRDGQRCSAAVAFLRPALQAYGPDSARKTLTVASSAHVTRLLYDESDPTKVVGVQYRRGQGAALKDAKELKAFAKREVILSAGAINTPQLLLLSGLGPKADLEKLGISVVRDLPAVGRHLQDHPAVCSVYRISRANATAPPANANAKAKKAPAPETTEPAINEAALSATNLLNWALHGDGQLTTSGFEAVAFLQTGASEHVSGSRPDVQIHFGATGGAPLDRQNFNFDDSNNTAYVPPEHGMFICPVLLHPESRGTITLASADPLAHPIIEPNYFHRKEDSDALVQALKISHQISKMPAFFKFNPRSELDASSPGNPHPFGSTAYWEWVVQRTSATCYHPTSTARMGTSKLNAVVDLELKVFGVKGLRVVDASVFPTVPGGNTNAPVIAVAEKAADIIIAGVKQADEQAAAMAAAEAKHAAAVEAFMKSTPPPQP